MDFDKIKMVELGTLKKGVLPLETLTYFLKYMGKSQKDVTIHDVYYKIVSGILYYFNATVKDKDEVFDYSVELWEQPWLETPYDIDMKLNWKLKK